MFSTFSGPSLVVVAITVKKKDRDVVCLVYFVVKGQAMFAMGYQQQVGSVLDSLPRRWCLVSTPSGLAGVSISSFSLQGLLIISIPCLFLTAGSLLSGWVVGKLLDSYSLDIIVPSLLLV